MVGAFHWTKNCGTFKAGMNGTEISCEKNQMCHLTVNFESKIK